MDFLTRKEIEGLKQDIKAKDIAVEADKYAFEAKLLNGIGENMMNELRNPSKPSWWSGIKMKYARWKKIKKEEKELKQLQDNIEKEMGGF